MINTLGRHAVALTALMWMGTTAHADLVIGGSATGVPGQELTLSIALDAPVSSVDDLTLTLDFDPGVLAGIDAVEGALLAGSAFTPNVAGGSAVASFLSTQTGFGPGILAIWKFRIDSGAHVPGVTFITPHLQTSIVDEQTTDIDGKTFAIQIVPEPSLGVLLIAGVMIVGCARGLRRTL